MPLDNEKEGLNFFRNTYFFKCVIMRVKNNFSPQKKIKKKEGRKKIKMKLIVCGINIVGAHFSIMLIFMS